ncbi:iron/ascorbate oxidoreductase [Schizosaccharomyces octosporus yFS286]|uniref:Iron/ascorbate oxidoreductase n=1 Tax=Schizosaccharomyces octosporus (strain yFS286) TaxID=483514 RepID=S9RB73_SCHOY|nr:iron/ascorbate oxidoreductase [Schizosaccharomyces octosporus yFS286]EPX75390.1 iron/ascorbate oxidoreductase [Schizosaccharomyces octosporus yFS286]
MKSMKLPCIDLSEQNTNLLSKSVADACKEWGFFTLKNHGIRLEDVQVLFKQSDEFFKLPSEEKEKYVFHGSDLPSGYSRHQGEGVYSQKPQYRAVKEYYDIAEIPNSNPEGLSQSFRERLPELKLFQRQCYSLSLRILELIALGFEIPKDTYSKHHSSTEDFLRFIEYMVPEGKGHVQDDVDTDSHFDYGTITLLFQRDYGCLQIQPPQTQGFSNPEWVRVSVDKEVISVNVSDMLEFWTGGKIKSTVHQIKIDPHIRERQMIAYFSVPDLDFPITGYFDEGDGKKEKTMTMREFRKESSSRQP